MSASPAEFLVEITRMGGWQKVAVLDPLTGREAVVRGPLHASEADLVRLARRRLGDSAVDRASPHAEAAAGRGGRSGSGQLA